jgi:hypothetical protein
LFCLVLKIYVYLYISFESYFLFLKLFNIPLLNKMGILDAFKENNKRKRVELKVEQKWEIIEYRKKFPNLRFPLYVRLKLIIEKLL